MTQRYLRILLLYMTALLGGLSLQAGNKIFETDSLFAAMGPNDKGAILVVHFGTTHDDTRRVTLDAINERIAAAYPDLELRQAYSSRIVRKRLAARGVEIPTPGEALKKLAQEGFTHLLVVSTTIVDGVEMESLSYEVAHQQRLFKKVRLVTPLLFYESDYKELVSIMTAHLDPGGLPMGRARHLRQCHGSVCDARSLLAEPRLWSGDRGLCGGLSLLRGGFGASTCYRA